jgi:hypothetical protein
VNRWIALAQLDGWGEEHRLLAIVAARAIGCPVADLLPYDVAIAPSAGPAPADQTLAVFDRLAGM